MVCMAPTVCYNTLCHCQVEFTLSGLSAEELATVQKTLHDIVSAFNMEELQGVCVLVKNTRLYGRSKVWLQEDMCLDCL